MRRSQFWGKLNPFDVLSNCKTPNETKCVQARYYNLPNLHVLNYSQPRLSAGVYCFVRRHALGQWRDNCLCRPCNAGGPARVGGPCANHQKIFSRHSCRLCIVVLMDAAQFRLLRIVRSLGRGDPMTMFAAFAGGPEFLVTPLLWVCLS